MFKSLSDFYRSEEWVKFRDLVIAERTREDGLIYDEVTEKPILRRYDLILHHKIFLTEDNVHDYSISLNPENIMVVSHKTHNQIHEKLGHSKREIYIVYGSPLSGKSSWVKENASKGDLIIDIDSIWACVSGQDYYIKPGKLNAVVFSVRDCLMDAVKHRLGFWDSCYIVGGFPLISERERLVKELGARTVYIEATKEECLERLERCTDARDKKEWAKYIETWFRRFGG